MVVKEVNGVEHLCAYYSLNNDVDSSNFNDDLKEYIKGQLPDYMVPSYFVKLDKFPTTPNGKTDFKNLPDIEVKEESLVEPQTKTEQVLFDILKEILGTEEFGIETDLFSVGLTSLSVINLISAISDKFDVVLAITHILKIKTIKEIALEIESNLSPGDNDELTHSSKLYPLTANQLGVYFDCVKDAEKLAYNLPKYINFGNIDEFKLKKAIIKVINSHPYLKTHIVMKEGAVYQEPRNNMVIDDLIEIADLGNDEIDDNYINNFIKPFDLSEGPLFRFKIIKDSKGVSLLSDFHHIIVDGTSLNLLFNEIALLYDDLEIELEKEAINGFDYSLNEVKIEGSNIYKEAKLFHFNKIKEFDEGSLVTPDLKGVEEEGVAEEKARRCKYSASCWTA